MMPSPHKICTGSAIALATVLICCLTGCSDFSQRYFGGIRKETGEEGTPRPASPLAIDNSPAVPRLLRDDGVRPAGYLDLHDPPATASPTDADSPILQHPMRLIYQRAAKQHAAMDSYIFRLTRREVVGKNKQPQEVIRVYFRREPFSVYLKWLGEENKGREVVYVRGKYKDQMQIQLAANDVFALLGRRLSISPDDSLARSKCRYPITGTGFGAIIERYGQLVAGIEKGDPREGTAKYLGKVKRPEFVMPVEAVHQVLPPAAEPLLPKGGQRWWFFDATSGLPVLLITHDPDGEVEYYCHEHIQWPVRLDDDDFNPDKLWRK